MGERIKTAIAVLGLIGTVAAIFMVYDRFWQHPRPNIPRFESEIASRDESSERFYNFLLKNQGKIIYFDVSRLENIALKPTFPRKGQPFRFNFLRFCDAKTNLCTTVTILVEAAQGVEAQVFNPAGAFLQVKGYFFVVAFESHMNSQPFTLHPVSGEQTMSK